MDTNAIRNASINIAVITTIGIATALVVHAAPEIEKRLAWYYLSRKPSKS